MSKVLSVSIGTTRGPKKQVDILQVNKQGIIGDIHAGPWNRQVSIISLHHIDKFIKHTGGRSTVSGEFAENILVDYIDNKDVKVFDRFVIGTTELEVTQIGKPFHDEFRELGNYLMPHVGIFCRVVKSGIIKAKDNIEHKPKVFKALVITLSDRASSGDYEDRSGPITVEILDTFFKSKNKRFEIIRKVIPDNKEQLTNLLDTATEDKTDLIITTGGTGIGFRDITVDVVQNKLDKEIPGIMEMIRVKYGAIKPNALLSRGVAGVINQSMVYTLPGSVKAVKEYMSEITKTLDHLFYMLHGIDVH